MQERSKPRFDGTINLGHVLQVVVLAGSVALFAGNIQAALKTHDQRITTLEQSTLAVQTLGTRVTVLENTMGQVTATLDRIYAEQQATNGRLTSVQVTVAEIAARLRGAPTPAE